MRVTYLTEVCASPNPVVEYQPLDRDGVFLCGLLVRNARLAAGLNEPPGLSQHPSDAGNGAVYGLDHGGAEAARVGAYARLASAATIVPGFRRFLPLGRLSPLAAAALAR